MTIRNLHRDLGYFYVGLIIAFAFSGIFLNHRKIWHPSKYKAEVKEITLSMPENAEMIDETFVKSSATTLGIKDGFRRFKVDKGMMEASYESHDLKVDISTGKGEVVRYVKVPLLAQMTQLHQETNDWWIYYSDIFGIAMLTIACTGMLMFPSGPNSFKERGWKLALLGIIFPLIFLFLLS